MTRTKTLVIAAFLANSGALHGEDYKGFDESLVQWDQLKTVPSTRIYIFEPISEAACLYPSLKGGRINVGNLPNCIDVESARQLNKWHRKQKIQLRFNGLNLDQRDRPFWEEIETFDLNDFGPQLDGDILRPEPPTCG